MKARVPLREVAQINPGLEKKLADDDLCSFVPMESVDEVSGKIERPQARRHLDVKKGYTPFQEGDAIVAKITPCMENGKAAIARRLIGGIGFGSTEFHVVRPSQALVGDWFHYFWLRPETRREAERHMTGSAGQKRVPEAYLQELRIPLPPRDEQELYVALLERADRFRRMCRYALEVSEGLLGAVFLEMFGDPVRNPCQYPLASLDEISLKITDGEHLNPKFVTGGMPIVMAEQVEDWRLNLGSCKNVSVEDFNRFTKKCCPEQGDLLLVSRGATIGRSCVVDTRAPFCLMGSVILIKPDGSRILPSFLWAQLRLPSIRRMLSTTSGASAQQAIYIANLRDRNVVVPTLADQQRYATFVGVYRKSRQVHIEALRQADHLFQTLLDEAFGDGV